MIPINHTVATVRTIAQWRAYGRQQGLRSNAWRNCARHYALQHGKAIVFHGDDSATIMKRDDSKARGITIHTFRAHEICWHDGTRPIDQVMRAKRPDYLMTGETLWNGARVSHYLATSYNRLTDKIAAFEQSGRAAPQELLNGRHNLIASAI